MLVKATKKGYFGRLRNPGDEFEIDSEKQFSKNWMEKVDAPKQSKKADS